MPSTRIDGVDGLRAVGRGLDERERVDRAAAAAARAVALAVQRAEPGERGEADGQLREAVAAAVGPGPPGGVQLRDVGHHGRPPGGPAGPVVRAGGTGVDEQRRLRGVEHVEQRSEALEPVGRGEHVGPDLEPDRAALQRIAQSAPGRARGCRPSPTGGTGPAARARRPARRRRALPPARAGAGPGRAPPTARRRRARRRRRPRAPRAASGSWSAGSIAYVRSPGRWSSQPTSRGAAAARAQSGQEGLGPEVLVEVRRHRSEAIH